MGSVTRYTPFGDYRGSSGPNPITDRAYTGQKENMDLGLYYYNARYYVSYINRFISADSIIPEPADPQSYNRYAYARNNPLKYVDPTGHCIVQYSGDVRMNEGPYGTSGLCPNTKTPLQEGHAAMDEYHASLVEPPDYPIYNTLLDKKHPCSLTLNECFYYRDRQGTRYNFLKDFNGYGESNPIPIDEFNQLLTGVAGELYLHDVDSPGFKGDRKGYDTPFYNGGGKGGDESKSWPHDQRVCIESIGCYGRSEINYFAQGMWSAAAGESLTTAKVIAWGWKELSYGESPSEEVYFWVEYGYRYYEDKARYWNGLQ